VGGLIAPRDSLAVFILGPFFGYLVVGGLWASGFLEVDTLDYRDALQEAA
jgi:hypothetical protein